MPMQTTKSWSPKMAFVLGEQSLRRLLGIITGVSNNIGYILECSDRSTISCSSLDEVLGFPNAKHRRITALTLHTPYGQDTYVQVRFREHVSLDPVECTVRGDDERVLVLSSKLDEAISSLKQWYTLLAFQSSLWFLFLALVSLTLSLLLLRLVTIGPLSRPGYVVMTDAQLLGVCSRMELITFGISWIQGMLFPRAAFLIGDGESRYSRIAFLRKGLILPFLIGLIVWRVTK